MSHIISSLCIGEKDGSCIEVCPVDCIEDGGEQMYINPDICIDCGLCMNYTKAKDFCVSTAHA
ncbi:MAG: hypothetical protein EBY80_14050 [Actinobacteria bacterium]|nr:hypothetical protein [Actinomycetota bacterium]NDA79419.1 hypothetical protein [Actinomycetota bacterium]